jgi:heme oxygenase
VSIVTSSSDRDRIEEEYRKVVRQWIAWQSPLQENITLDELWERIVHGNKLRNDEYLDRCIANVVMGKKPGDKQTSVCQVPKKRSHDPWTFPGPTWHHQKAQG